MSNESYEAIYNEVPFVGALDDTKTHIVVTLTQVLMKLPENVRKLALERCVFASIPIWAGGVTQQAILPKQAMVNPHNFYLIVIPEGLTDSFPDIEMSRLRRKRLSRMERAKMRGERLKHVFAHEIAHAYIKYAYPGPPEDVEGEAERLAAKWGFSEQGEWYRQVKKAKRSIDK